MRLAAQAKGGFYPAKPAAVAMAAGWLQPPASEQFCILDPCAGIGDAIIQLAEALGCPMGDVYAIELDERRSETVNQRLGQELGCKVQAPASFFGTATSAKAFSFVWCNPPFDDELGGGKRVEHSFLQRSTHLLVPGGVIALVFPEHVAEGDDLRNFLLSWYTEIRVVDFPVEQRPFDEVVVFGIRREKQVPLGNAKWYDCERLCSGIGQPDFIYRLPRSNGPARFQKTYMTDRELLAALARSPLRRHLEVVAMPRLLSPPMSLGNGHRALLLAAGQLDGRVCPPGEPPHVVRGTAVKRSYVQSVETQECKDGEATKTVIAERIVLTVRVATAAGEILTLTPQSEQPAEQGPTKRKQKQQAAA